MRGVLLLPLFMGVLEVVEVEKMSPPTAKSVKPGLVVEKIGRGSLKGLR